ncbi:MAG: aminotransferase class V-fold PLP-dependent enzyme [bacterium]|nr:aminotransferase class V-fold PLP-dependent enzyme [bacterium]
MIYFDNAATSWPKPDAVIDAMLGYARDIGANPGRSGHRLAVEAERVRLDAREAVARLFGMADPMRVIFTLNATEALNLVIRGLLPRGSHVVTTSMEHNSVMRPLRAAEERGVAVSLAHCRPDGTLEPETVEELVRRNTRLIVVTHASNVCGTVLPVRDVGAIARKYGIPLLADAAQTAGCWPIDLDGDNIDLLAFTGHKALLGPTGTGGLAVNAGFDVSLLPAFTRGGTGSLSEEETHPDFLPDRYEAGTPNAIGLAGLAAAVRHILARGVQQVRDQECCLTERLTEGLRGITGVRLIGTGEAHRQTSVVSFTVEDCACSELAQALDERFAILSRPGLHCAPRAHRTLGTFPEGTVRFSLGLFNTQAEIDQAIDAVATLAKAKRDG